MTGSRNTRRLQCRVDISHNASCRIRRQSRTTLTELVARSSILVHGTPCSHFRHTSMTPAPPPLSHNRSRPPPARSPPPLAPHLLRRTHRPRIPLLHRGLRALLLQRHDRAAHAYMRQALFMPGHIERIAGFASLRHGASTATDLDRRVGLLLGEESLGSAGHVIRRGRRLASATCRGVRVECIQTRPIASLNAQSNSSPSPETDSPDDP
jgi:hypothetical protein